LEERLRLLEGLEPVRRRTAAAPTAAVDGSPTRSPRRARPRSLAFAIGAFLALGGAVAIVVTRDAARTNHGIGGPVATVTGDSAATPAASAAPFSKLAAKGLPADRAMVEWARSLPTIGKGDPVYGELDPETLRDLDSGNPAVDVYAMTGPKWICLVSVDVASGRRKGAGCRYPAAAADPATILGDSSTLADGTIALTVLVPDPVVAMTAVDARGDSSGVEIDANVGHATLHAPLAILESTLADGTIVRETFPPNGSATTPEHPAPPERAAPTGTADSVAHAIRTLETAFPALTGDRRIASPAVESLLGRLTPASMRPNALRSAAAWGTPTAWSLRTVADVQFDVLLFGSDHVCFIGYRVSTGTYEASGCDSLVRATSTTTSLGFGGHAWIAMLAPSGVTALTATLASGRTVSVDITGNVAFRALPEPARSYVVHRADGDPYTVRVVPGG
jgi:hypothetical protein